MGNCASTAEADDLLLRATAVGDSVAAAEALERGAHVNVTTADGQTPLGVACGQRDARLARVLLRAGASTRLSDADGAFALHRACAAGASECVDLLLSAGDSASVETADGSAPLHFAANAGDGETIRLLLEHGAFVDVEDADKDTPLSIAAMNGYSTCVHLLLKRGAAVPWQTTTSGPAHKAIEFDQLGCLKVMLDHYPHLLKVPDGSDLPILHVAAHYGAVEICSYLLNQGASVLEEDAHGNIALFAAVLSCNKAIVDLLLENGSDWHHRNHDGLSPLQYLDHDEDANTAKYHSDVRTVADVKRAAGHVSSDVLVIDLIRRLETQRIRMTLNELQHQSEMLLFQTRGQEQADVQVQRQLATQGENARLKRTIGELQREIRQLQAVTSSHVVNKLASELANVRTKTASSISLLTGAMSPQQARRRPPALLKPRGSFLSI